MPRWRFNMLMLSLLLLLGVLQYRLWLGKDGIVNMWKLKRAATQLDLENEHLKKQNAKLLFQVKRLQKSSEATEGRARNELGMIKKGETFYQIVK